MNLNAANVVPDIINLIKNVIIISSIITVLAFAHWLLPIVLIIAGLPGILLLMIFKNKKFNKTVETTPIAREMDYTYNLIYRRNAAKEIRVFQLGQFLINRWENLHYKLRKVDLHQTAFQGKISIFFLIYF